MNSTHSDIAAQDFRTRVLPLLRAAVLRRDADAHVRGWLFEIIDPDQTGFCILRRMDTPSIRLTLEHGGAIRTVMWPPGKPRVIPLALFDAAFAETLVAAWWADITS